MVSTAEKNALAFEVLSDVGQNVGRAFGLVYEFTEELKSAYQGFKLDIPAHNDSPGEWALPVSATYVIDRNGMIVYACTDPDYRDRADPRDVLKVLTERAVAATEAKLRGLPRTAGGNDAEAALHRGKRTDAPHARIDRIRQTHRRARPARRQPDDAEQAWVEYWNKLLYQGLLPHKLKEMCRIKISVAHQCGYCSTVRSNVAKAEGLTESMI